MVFEDYGRQMTRLLREGKPVEALKGVEGLYWFTPGTRYFRMVEKIFFGDSHQGYLLFLLLMSLGIFHTVASLAGIGWAWLISLYFLFSPAGNLSFLQYLIHAKNGYGETLAVGCFFCSLALLFSLPPWNPQGKPDLGKAWWAGCCLAMAALIRPNFGLATIWAGVLSLLIFRRVGLTRAGWALVAGLALGLWMPFHNWFYGNEFHLVSKSTSTAYVTLGLGSYLAALMEVLRGVETSAIQQVVWAQIRGWLWSPSVIISSVPLGLATAFHFLKLVSLLLSVGVFVNWLRAPARLTPASFLAGLALAAHLPVLFVFSTDQRYATLGWDLTILVAVLLLNGLTNTKNRHGSEKVERVELWRSSGKSAWPPRCF